MRLFTVLPVAVTLISVPAAAQSPPPIRQLGPVVAKSSESFGGIVAIRALSGGRVLVNEPMKRRVLLFDSTLASFTVVADSTSATGNAYGGRFGGLIPYRADSTLFVDPASLSMLVIDPSGKVGRVMSVPRAEDVNALAGFTAGSVGFDATGRLVYRAFPRLERRMAGAGGGFQPPEIPDTAAILRVDLATRQVDTAGFIKTPRPNIQVSRDSEGRMSMTSTINPLPVVDEWAVLSDGSIALVRGRDYHVDWINPDGARTSSPKIPFEWQRLTDEDKVAFIDSVKAARERMAASAPQQVVTSGGATPPAGSAPTGAREAGGGAGERVSVTITQGGGGAPGGVATRGGTQVTTPRVTFIAPSELPDYKPPFFAGAVRADMDGNLWIRTIPTKAIPGGPVYDVVNRQSGLAERVQVPAGRTIVGFGPGGVVYLAHRDADRTYLERAKVR